MRAEPVGSAATRAAAVPSAAVEPVPVHPEPVPGEDQVVRWSVPPGIVGFVGVPRALPASLDALVRAGVVETLLVEPAAVRITLAAGSSWRAQGATVRSALQDALAAPAQWTPPADDTGADGVLRMAVEQVLGGEVGDYIRSHGGRVALLSAHDDEVVLSLSGACSSCPASESTLGERIETGLRALYPGLRRLTARPDPGIARGRRMLGLLPVTRG